MENYRVSQRRVCRLILLGRSTCRYVSCKKSDEPLRMRLREDVWVRSKNQVFYPNRREPQSEPNGEAVSHFAWYKLREQVTRLRDRGHEQ